MLSHAQIRELKRSKKGDRNRLAAAMQLAGVTQVQVAAGTGYTQSFVSKVQNGQYSDLPGETMRTFATFFGCSIEDMFPAPEAVAS